MDYRTAAYRIDSSKLPQNDRIMIDEMRDVRDPRDIIAKSEESFPLIRTVLWNRAVIGEVTSLSMNANSDLRLSVNERTLKLAYRHSATQSSQVDVFLIGSLVIDSDSLTVKVDRFDPGREVTTKSDTNTIVKQRLPTAVVPGDYIIPMRVLLKETDEVEDKLFSSADLDASLMILHNRLRSLSNGLDPSKFLLTKSCCHFHPDIDELVLSFSCNSLHFTDDYIAKPINNIPLIPTALARFLAGPMRIAEKQTQPKSGFLTFDRTRKLLLLLESDPKVKTLPIVGVWISGVETLENPHVWLACLRFQFCNEISDKAAMQPFSFLLVHYPSHKLYPNFYECSPKDIDSDIPSHEIVKVKEEVIIQQMSDNQQESICFNLSSEKNEINDQRNTESYSQMNMNGNTQQETPMSRCEATSSLEDYDTEHHPRSLKFQPHIQKPISAVPSVPDISLCHNTSYADMAKSSNLENNSNETTKDSEKQETSSILPSSYLEINSQNIITDPLDISIDESKENYVNQRTDAVSPSQLENTTNYEDNLIREATQLQPNNINFLKTYDETSRNKSKILSDSHHTKLSANNTECPISDSELSSDEDDKSVTCNCKNEKMKQKGMTSKGISYSSRRNKNANRGKRRKKKPDPYELIQMQQRQLEELQKQVTQLLSERIPYRSTSVPMERHSVSDASIQVNEVRKHQEVSTETSLLCGTRSIGTTIGNSLYSNNESSKNGATEAKGIKLTQKGNVQSSRSPPETTNQQQDITCANQIQNVTVDSQSTQETSLHLSISGFDPEIQINRDTFSITTPQPSLCEVDISCFDGDVFASPQRITSMTKEKAKESKDMTNGTHNNMSRQSCNSESSKDQDNQHAFYETFMTQVQSLLAHQLDIADAEEITAINHHNSQENKEQVDVYKNTQHELNKICGDSPGNKSILPRNKPQDNSLLIPNHPRIQCDSIWLGNVNSERYHDENDTLAAAIALKYLPSENAKLAQNIVNERMRDIQFQQTNYSSNNLNYSSNHLHGNKMAFTDGTVSNFNGNMSFASREYLKRYNLLDETPIRHVEKQNFEQRNVLQSKENRILDVEKLQQLPKLK